MMRWPDLIVKARSTGDMTPRQSATLIGAVLLIALLVIGSLWTWQVWREKHAAALERSRQGAALVSEYTSRVMQAKQMLLNQIDRVMQDNPGIEPLRLHQTLQAMDAGFQYSTSLGVIDADGNAVAGSRTFPLKANFSDREYFKLLHDGGQTLVIDRLLLRPLQRDTMTIARRLSGDSFRGVATASTEIGNFSDFLAKMSFEEGSAAVLVRADGKILARPEPDEPPTTMLPDGTGMRAMAQAAAGYFDAPGRMDGIVRTYAFVRVPDLPLFAVHGFSKQAIWQDTLKVMAGNFLILIVCAVLAYIALTGMLRRIKLEHVRIAAEQDRRLLDEARRTSAIRETMLKEVNHRIHNNLQTIQSLIRIQSRKPIEPQLMLQEIGKRVWAISEIHNLLYRSAEYSSLELSSFIRVLATNPGIVPPERGVTVRCDLETVTIDIRQAVPVALIVLEAVTNALKHGFPDGRKGEIAITLRREGDAAEITVRDNGIGLTGEGHSASGTKLAAVLAEQIEGSFSFRDARADESAQGDDPKQGGVEMRLRFPLAAPGMAAMPEQDAAS
jgi:two-component sensor histidine kinase